MNTHSRTLRAALLVTLSAVSSLGAPLRAAAQNPPAPQAPPQVTVTAATPSARPTIADLVAPIALYPDLLLAQVLTISVTPQELLDLADWLVKNDSLTGAKASDAAKAGGFSTSAQYLALFPQVVDNMAKQIDWTTQLGDAYTADAKGVMAAIQAKRQAAVAAGNLKTSTQMTVTTKKADDGTSYIEIAPTDPKVIYVPVYNPVNVYVTNPAPAAPAPTTTTTTVVQQSGVSSGEAVGIALLSFGVGMAIGSTINNNYYPYPHWGYGMYYGGHPYYPPPYHPPHYPGYHPAYGYHPPANYHWNQVNHNNITINNNNYYNKFNNNNVNRNPSNANRPGQVANTANRPGGASAGARPSTTDRPSAGMASANPTRPQGGAGAAATTRPAGGAGDRGYGAGAAGASRPSSAPARPAPQASQGGGGGAFGGSGGGSGASARAASSRGRASAGASRGGGGGGGRRR